MALTDKGRKTIIRFGILIALVVGVFALRSAAKSGKFVKFLPQFMVPKVSLADNSGDITLKGTAKSFLGLPSTTPAKLPASAPVIRANFWAWNSQMGCEYANGGPVTTEGSLMAKNGVKLFIERQDDNSQLQAQLVALAKSLHDGNPDPTEGVHFVGIMLDGAHPFIDGLNQQLVKAYGADYRAEIIGSCGYSRGEDAVWGPESWKTDPRTALKGGTVIGVLRDGDINIALHYASDNGVPVNPDEKTYDPDALNFINSESYTKAAEQFVQGYCEDRKVVKNNKPTGETKNVCADAVATWTPGDVTVAKQKGGVVRVISTAPGEYENEMPHALIGIHKWNTTHRSAVENMLAAFLAGGNQVLTYPQALDRAAEIAQSINKEAGANADYWKRYYLGVQEKDKTGKVVPLGGSKANNLADNLALFGLAEGMSPKSSRAHAVYTLFGSMLHQMYPKIVPTEPQFDSVTDLSYLKVVAAREDDAGTAETVTYTKRDTLTKVLGHRAVSINFATGSATLTGSGEAQLERIFNELSMNNLNVIITGHTDNVGNPATNLTLSQARADAVRTWLEHRSPGTFPTGRISAKGYGDSQPVASNATKTGQAQNRRVEITIGQ
jgi:OOP family OmpA-OmpF porin